MSSAKSCLELHREQLSRMIHAAGLPTPKGWTSEDLAEWVDHDATGRANTFAPLLLAVSEHRGGSLPPALREAGVRYLALLRLVPLDLEWGTPVAVRVLNELEQCFGGAQGIRWLESQLGVRAGEAWLPPDGQASAKALVTYAALNPPGSAAPVHA